MKRSQVWRAEAHWRLRMFGRRLQGMSETAHLLLARCLPRSVRYWVLVHCICEATTGRWADTVLPDIRAVEVVRRLLVKHETKGDSC